MMTKHRNFFFFAKKKFRLFFFFFIQETETFFPARQDFTMVSLKDALKSLNTPKPVGKLFFVELFHFRFANT